MIGPAFFVNSTPTDPYFANVVALLHFDDAAGSTSFYDSSSYHRATGGTFAATSSTQKKWGTCSAAIFTGTGSGNQVTIPHDTLFHPGTAEFTIEAWVYITGGIGTAQIIAQKALSTGVYPYQLYLTAAGKFEFRGFNDSNALIYTATGTTVATTGQWYFVQARRRNTASTSNFELAVNGVQEASVGASLTHNLVTNTGPLTIGNYESGANFPLTGYVDDFRYTRNVARAFELPTAAFPEIPSSIDPYFSSVVLLSHFKGANGATTPAPTDLKGHTITQTGSPAYTTDFYQWPSSCLWWQAGSQYLSSASSTDWDCGTGDFCDEAWVRPTAVGSADRAIFSRQAAGTTGAAYQFRINSSGKLQGVFRPDGSSTATTVTGATTVTANNWHHVAISRVGGTVRVFLDGVVDGSGTYAGSFDPATARPLTIGAIDPGDGVSGYFAGYMDEVRRTKGSGRYTASFTVPTAAFPNS